MDMRTGKIYDTKEEALAAGVPESDIAMLTGEMDKIHKDMPEVKFSSGPFKDRLYKRVNGQLVRTK